MRQIKLILAIVASFLFHSNSNAFVIYEGTPLWNQDKITFYFMDGSIKQQAEVRLFTKIWERYSGIKFVFVTHLSQVNTRENYYKITFKGGVNNAHRGAIDGMVRLGQLSDDVVFRKKTILHEFGHVLGLGHEHQRVDRHSVFYNPKMLVKCAKFQKKSQDWCNDNMFETYSETPIVLSKYDPQSIMHYRIQDIIGSDTAFDDIDELLDPPNTLSLSDKIYIANVYNPDLSLSTIERMHQQDVWNQKQFENKSKDEKESIMANLETASCKTLKYNDQSEDGRMCSNGFMIIGQDDLSFHHPELATCFLFVRELEKTLATHPACQQSYTQLIKSRANWNQRFSKFGQCKILDTGIKNNQDYYCEEGYSFVTKDNDMAEDKTRCLYSHEQVHREMVKNEICNFSNYEYNIFIDLLAKQTQQSMETPTCKVVNRSYETLKCPDDFNYTIINKSYQDKPINNKCFGNEHQAIRAMNEIDYCSAK